MTTTALALLFGPPSSTARPTGSGGQGTSGSNHSGTSGAFANLLASAGGQDNRAHEASAATGTQNPSGAGAPNDPETSSLDLAQGSAGPEDIAGIDHQRAGINGFRMMPRSSEAAREISVEPPATTAGPPQESADTKSPVIPPAVNRYEGTTTGLDPQAFQNVSVDADVVPTLGLAPPSQAGGAESSDALLAAGTSSQEMTGTKGQATENAEGRLDNGHSATPGRPLEGDATPTKTHQSTTLQGTDFDQSAANSVGPKALHQPAATPDQPLEHSSGDGTSVATDGPRTTQSEADTARVRSLPTDGLSAAEVETADQSPRGKASSAHGSSGQAGIPESSPVATHQTAAPSAGGSGLREASGTAGAPERETPQRPALQPNHPRHTPPTVAPNDSTAPRAETSGGQSVSPFPDANSKVHGGTAQAVGENPGHSPTQPLRAAATHIAQESSASHDAAGQGRQSPTSSGAHRGTAPDTAATLPATRSAAHAEVQSAHSNRSAPDGQSVHPVAEAKSHPTSANGTTAQVLGQSAHPDRLERGAQPALKDITTPEVSRQTAPSSRTAPEATGQPGPTTRTTPDAAGQPAPTSQTTPDAAGRPAPTSQTTPDAAGRAAPTSQTTPDAAGRPAPTSQTTPDPSGHLTRTGQPSAQDSTGPASSRAETGQPVMDDRAPLRRDVRGHVDRVAWSGLAQPDAGSTPAADATARQPRSPLGSETEPASVRTAESAVRLAGQDAIVTDARFRTPATASKPVSALSSEASLGTAPATQTKPAFTVRSLYGASTPESASGAQVATDSATEQEEMRPLPAPARITATPRAESQRPSGHVLAQPAPSTAIQGGPALEGDAGTEAAPSPAGAVPFDGLEEAATRSSGSEKSIRGEAAERTESKGESSGAQQHTGSGSGNGSAFSGSGQEQTGRGSLAADRTVGAMASADPLAQVFEMPETPSPTGAIPDPTEFFEARILEVMDEWFGPETSATFERMPPGARSRLETASAAWMRSLRAAGNTGPSDVDPGAWKEVTIDLEDGLGSVNIRARRDADQLAIQIQTSDATTGSRLTAATDRLQDELRQRYGADVDLSFGTQTGAEDRAGGQNARQGGPRVTGGSSETPSGTSSQTSSRRGADRVWVG